MKRWHWPLAVIALSGLVASHAAGQSGTRSRRTVRRQPPPTTTAPQPAPDDGQAARPTTTIPEPSLLASYAQAPLALDGNDPIALIEGGAIKPGLPRLTSGFDGLTYRFADPASKTRFDQNPEAFAVGLGGNSIVVWKSQGKNVPGSIKHHSIYGGRLYLLANEKEKAAFDADPAVFADADLILQGFSVVGLVDNEALAKGNKEVRAIHHGRVLYFVNRAERSAFLADPGKYCPSLGGWDPVSVAAGKPALGIARLSVVYKNRLYSMSTEENRDKFLRDPQPYSDLDVAAGGNCPVTLADKQRKQPGHYGITYLFNGQRYLFAGEAERRKFAEDPTRYVSSSPAAKP